MSWGFLCCACVFLLGGQVSGYHDIVNQLEQFVLTNKTFAHQLNLTFMEAGYGPTSQSPMTYTIMYETFDMWLTQAPNISNDMYNYITLFSSTFTGSHLCETDYVSNWFKNYLNDYHTYLNSYNSTDTLQWWLNWNEINMSDYIIPINGYQSFNQFFTRQLRPNARPIDSPNDDTIVTSPNDGYIWYASQLSNGIGMNDENVNKYNEILTIKGVKYNISKIIGSNDENLLSKYENGTIIQIILGAYNYHHYHAPISGKVTNIVDLEGLYFYISWYAMKADSFELILREDAENNRRGVIYINSDKLNTTVIYVAVGVYEYSSVSWIVNETDWLNKGDDMGYFQVGGSTAVLLFENDVVEKILVKRKDPIKMGQAVVKLKE